MGKERITMTQAAVQSKVIEAIAGEQKVRYAAFGEGPTILTDIFKDDINLVVWQRRLTRSLLNLVTEFLAIKPNFQSSLTVTPQSAIASVGDALGSLEFSELNNNIAELVDMYCCLFDLKRVGIRLTALDRAMCPKFHVDKVPCRLITTFQGIATEWLSHQAVDRSKLGAGSRGKSDSESGLYQHTSDIQRLHAGDVALLKGERWEGNENAGLVHRSPALGDGAKRLMLTLDFSS